MGPVETLLYSMNNEIELIEKAIVKSLKKQKKVNKILACLIGIGACDICLLSMRVTRLENQLLEMKQNEEE